MNAKFAALHDVAQVLAEHIRAETAVADVEVGAPQQPGATTQPGVRLTLLSAAPLPALSGEPPRSRRSLTPPALSISCFYLVSTSGAEGHDPVAAHDALGEVVRLIHAMPVLHLPRPTQVASPPSTVTERGEGQLRLTQVSMSIEQLAQIWLALRQPLQPCALLEAGPIQLASG